GSSIIRARGSTHPLPQATPDMGRTRWILILSAWTIVGLLFAVRRIVLVKVQGIHVSWVIVSGVELVYWYVWAAYTPLVIGLAKRFQLTGPRLVPHIAIHTITSLMMAPLASAFRHLLRRRPAILPAATAPAPTAPSERPQARTPRMNQNLLHVELLYV